MGRVDLMGVLGKHAGFGWRSDSALHLGIGIFGHCSIRATFAF